MKGSNNPCHMGRRKSYKAPQGLVKQKHSNHWYIKVRINGKLIYKSTKTSDLQEAELKLAKVRVALLSKVKVALPSLDLDVKEIIGKSKPFSQLMERYLKEVSINKRSAESDRFRSKPLVEFFKDLKIDSITVQDVYK